MYPCEVEAVPMQKLEYRGVRYALGQLCLDERPDDLQPPCLLFDWQLVQRVLKLHSLSFCYPNAPELLLICSPDASVQEAFCRLPREMRPKKPPPVKTVGRVASPLSLRNPCRLSLGFEYSQKGHSLRF